MPPDPSPELDKTSLNPFFKKKQVTIKIPQPFMEGGSLLSQPSRCGVNSPAALRLLRLFAWSPPGEQSSEFQI